MPYISPPVLITTFPPGLASPVTSRVAAIPRIIRSKNKAKSAFFIIEVFMKKSLILFLFIIIVIISQTACSVKSGLQGEADPDPVAKEGFFFDTVCTISIYNMKDMSEEKAGKIIDSAFKEAEKYEKTFSKQTEGTELWQLNHDGRKDVSEDLFKSIETGIRYGDISGGKFDITMGGVLDLWDFHNSQSPSLPSKSDMDKELRTVGYQAISLTKHEDGSGTVTLGKEGQEVDLGGIAKGYICDKISQHLKDKGVKSAIVNLGGNITVIGEKTKDKPFKVGIEKPYSERKEIIGTVDMRNQTVVTSGIYERYVEVNGNKYHHILDPATGWPIDTDVSSVTILSKFGNSMNCDAMSTTALLLGSEKGLQLVEKTPDMEALFQLKDGTRITTSGFKYEER